MAIIPAYIADGVFGSLIVGGEWCISIQNSQLMLILRLWKVCWPLRKETYPWLSLP